MSRDLSGDGTSSYLWTFDPWQRVTGNQAEQAPKLTPADFIYKMTPLAKLVFVLRNPTDRSPRPPSARFVKFQNFLLFLLLFSNVIFYSLLDPVSTLSHAKNY